MFQGMFQFPDRNSVDLDPARRAPPASSGWFQFPDRNSVDLDLLGAHARPHLHYGFNSLIGILWI